jgi:hypothetical protein
MRHTQHSQQLVREQHPGESLVMGMEGPVFYGAPLSVRVLSLFPFVYFPDRSTGSVCSTRHRHRATGWTSVPFVGHTAEGSMRPGCYRYSDMSEGIF